MQHECDKLRKEIEELELDKNRMHVGIESLRADVDIDFGIEQKFKYVSIIKN